MRREKIEDWAIESAGQEFRGDDFRALTGPGVYVFLQSVEVLYVGASHNLLQRATQDNHHARIARQECDVIKLFPCKSLKAAFKLESELIGRLNPKHNQNRRHNRTAELMGMERLRSLPTAR